MRVIWKNCIGTLSLAALGLGHLGAQDSGLDVRLKLRSGIGLTQAKDHLGRRTLGFGLEFGLATDLGRFTAELGYQMKPGDQYLEDVSKFPVAPGAPPADPASSVDSRKTKMDGLTLRLGYGQSISDNWAWHAGLQIGGTKFRQEYIADVADEGWNTYEDTYNGVIQQNKIALSPFAGISRKVGRQGSVELSLLGLSYTSVNYVHTVGTVYGWGSNHTSLDRTEEQKRMMPHLEVAYAVRF